MTGQTANKECRERGSRVGSNHLTGGPGPRQAGRQKQRHLALRLINRSSPTANTASTTPQRPGVLEPRFAAPSLPAPCETF
jgi:hypothetical protein